jgi:hypothetical protein
MGQFSRDGEVCRRYWGEDSREQIVAWANTHGIAVTDATIS